MTATRRGLRQPAVLCAVLALLAAFVTVVLAPPAHAAVAYTWTGSANDPHADNHSWTDDLNWSPNGHPVSGDSVTVAQIPDFIVHIDTIPAGLQLANLQLLGGDDDTRIEDPASSLTVTGSFTWTGGELDTPLTLAAGSHGRIGAGPLKNLETDLTVNGTLAFDNTGTDEDHILRLWSGYAITVGPTGTLTSTGQSAIGYSSCCTEPAKIINHGTVSVTDGSLLMNKVELDQFHHVQVAKGANLHVTGLARLASGATYAGGGTMLLDGLAYPAPDLKHPEVEQGAALMTGNQLLSDGFVIKLIKGAPLTGVGAVVGAGTVELAGGTVYADLTVSKTSALRVTGSSASLLGDWTPSIAGYHGVLRIDGRMSVATGATLDLDTEVSTSIRRGGRLDLAAGATVLAMTANARVSVYGGGTLAVGAGGRSPAQLNGVTYSNAGTTSLSGAPGLSVSRFGSFRQSGGITNLARGATLTMGPTLSLAGGRLSGTGTVRGSVSNTAGAVTPGGSGTRGVLTIRGNYRQYSHAAVDIDVAGTRAGSGYDRLVVTGTATLAGRLAVSTKSRPAIGSSVVPLTAHVRRGYFSCVTATRWSASYPSNYVRLTATNGRTSACVRHASGKRLRSAALTTHRRSVSVDVSGTAGISARPSLVVLEVSVTAGSSAARVRLSPAPARGTSIYAARRHRVVQYVVVKPNRHGNVTFAKTGGTATVRVYAVGWVS